ncbi:hypothetical protein PIB30_100602 [Stylosanthes scabra]|uniref:Uncharacterized protein n=1 Tax=Stylosanthes scabra TaxID=79078 RepID=A0ABU6WY71_9FABA|nr:hypothetical protein [Stylosanthes scabra]
MLDLSGNNLQGPIPSSIFQLKRLSLLQLSTNRFSGTIYLNKIRSLPNLKTFDLSHNNLSVVVDDADQDVSSSAFPMMNNLLLASCRLNAFPSFLRNQSNLLDLDLSNNQIEGIIPNWIWKFEFLTSLNLSNNVLVGMEGPFQNLGLNLFFLDLHGNQLQGPAPIFTKSIIYLDYSNNNFSSFIPADIEIGTPKERLAKLPKKRRRNSHGEMAKLPRRRRNSYLEKLAKLPKMWGRTSHEEWRNCRRCGDGPPMEKLAKRSKTEHNYTKKCKTARSE